VLDLFLSLHRSNPYISALDISALIKRYLKEEGSDAVGGIMAGASVIASSKLAYPEILSAFMRKFRASEAPFVCGVRGNGLHVETMRAKEFLSAIVRNYGNLF